MMKRLLNFFVLVSGFFLASIFTKCNINSAKDLLTNEDSARIFLSVSKSLSEKNFFETNKSLTPELMDDVRRGYSFTYTTKKFSETISESDARSMHINYLKSAGQILDAKRDIIHYFTLSSENLAGLYEKGKDSGMRIYFGKGTDDGLSIILVPIKSNGDNDLTYIVDKLEPCPDQCMKGTKYTDENNTTDLNCVQGTIWYKPNILFDGKKNHYFNKDNTEIRVP